MTLAEVYGSSFFEVFKNISKVFLIRCFLCDLKSPSYFVEKCLIRFLSSYFMALLEYRPHFVHFPQVSSLNGSSRQKRKALLSSAHV